MASDPVPWMVAGNVEHSVNVARLLAYAGFGGSEGIVGPKDLEVRELAVPGPQVRVFSGACAVLNRFPGAKYEAYAGRFPTETVLDISPTGSGGGRSDLIVARIEDPFESGSPFPNDGSGIFLRPAVLSGVPAGTKDFKSLGYAYPAIPLARIDLPVSTGTITQAMIHDLRHLTAAVRREEWSAIVSPTSTSNLTSAAFAQWTPQATLSVDIPDWATHVLMEGTLAGILWGSVPATGTRTVAGYLRTMLGGTLTSDPVAYDMTTDTNADRAVFLLGGAPVAVPAALRGTTQTMILQGTKAAGANSYLISDTASMVSLRATFVQSPESNL